jgi:hypothetical protein
MSIGPPMFACRLQARIPVELEALYHRSRIEMTDEDKLLGIELLTEAYFDLIDTCFVRILDQLGSASHSKELSEAHRTIDEVKDKARHYLRWMAGFIANKRLPPVIAHFHAMIQQGEDGQPFMAFPLSNLLAAEVTRVVAILADGRAENFDEGSELIIHVMDEAMGPLAIEPKNLMKFNFVVDKTLNGVISLVQMLLKRMLHKLSPKIPTETHPAIATHLKSFLIV